MKPSIKDIQVEQNKANFISWLLTEFGENEFTNSEMKKRYDEVVTCAIENASENTIRNGLKTMLNDPASNWRFSAPVRPVRFYTVHRDKKNIHIEFDLACKAVMDVPFYAFIRYIDPVLTFPRFYTLNSELFECGNFFTRREEKITIHKAKAIGRRAYFNQIFEDTVYKWNDENELIEYFLDGKYSIEFDEIETVRYYFQLKGAKATNYIMNQTKTAKKLREERTQCIINEMTREDRLEVMEYLADKFDYYLE